VPDCERVVYDEYGLVVHDVALPGLEEDN
jgi:hypothetical protein